MPDAETIMEATTSERTTMETMTVNSAVQQLFTTTAQLAERVTRLEFETYKIQDLIRDTASRQDALSAKMDQFQATLTAQFDDFHDFIKAVIPQLCTPSPTPQPQKVPLQSKTTDDSTSSQSNNAKSTDKHQPSVTPNHEPYTAQAILPPITPTAIIIPHSTAVPTFAGKYSERPNQFLIRVQEYAETVHGWDRQTLLRGVSQFLRETALDWYCQLRISHRQPDTWPEFVKLFLRQFNTPITTARQEHDWNECKQEANESINEFLVRLRTIWLDQKPKETEVDLAKHLLCKMRNDLLSMIGISRGATLDEIVFETQRVEEILYRRDKEQRLRTLQKHVTFSEKSFPDHRQDSTDRSDRQYTAHRPVDQTYSSNTTPSTQRITNEAYTSDNRFRPSSPQWNTNNRSHSPNSNASRSPAQPCYSCGSTGHLTRNCPNRQATNRQMQSYPDYSKNVYGAPTRRGISARI